MDMEVLSELKVSGAVKREWDITEWKELERIIEDEDEDSRKASLHGWKNMSEVKEAVTSDIANATQLAISLGYLEDDVKWEEFENSESD
jgi:hypothetical protein